MSDPMTVESSPSVPEATERYNAANLMDALNEFEYLARECPDEAERKRGRDAVLDHFANLRRERDDLLRHLASLRDNGLAERSRLLAVLAIQSDRYVADAEFKQAVDDVVEITGWTPARRISGATKND